jgi:hypothetical protein
MWHKVIISVSGTQLSVHSHDSSKRLHQRYLSMNIFQIAKLWEQYGSYSVGSLYNAQLLANSSNTPVMRQCLWWMHWGISLIMVYLMMQIIVHHMVGWQWIMDWEERAFAGGTEENYKIQADIWNTVAEHEGVLSSLPTKEIPTMLWLVFL